MSVFSGNANLPIGHLINPPIGRLAFPGLKSITNLRVLRGKDNSPFFTWILCQRGRASKNSSGIAVVVNYCVVFMPPVIPAQTGIQCANEIVICKKT